MKRMILYLVILAAVVAVPVRPGNIGKMKPVQTVAVSKANGWFVLQTDTGDKGMGGTVLQALQNLKDTTAGILYLDTAEYLLLTKEATEAAGELEKELKPAVQLCVVTEDVEISEAAAYLDAHGKLPRLKHWENGLDLPVLGVFEEKLIFLKKVENKA